MRILTKNIEEVIKNLENINPDEEFAYEKILLAYLEISFLPIFINDVPKNTPVFKSRTQDNSNLYNKISDIFVPPRKAVKYFARCNRPHQPKFYCSENRPTSFLELVDYWATDHKKGDKLYVTISRWILEEKMPTIIIPIPSPSKRVSDFDKRHGQAFDTFKSQFDEETQKGFLLFYNFLFKHFSQPAKNDLKTYLLTSGYCNLALAHAEEEASAISYPSVPYGGKGINFCLNKNFAKKTNIKLTHVLQNEFTVTDTKDGKHTFTETGKTEAEEINLDQNLIKW